MRTTRFFTPSALLSRLTSSETAPLDAGGAARQTARGAVVLGLAALTACGPVLEEQRLVGAYQNDEVTNAGQQNFDPQYYALTMEMAQALNKAPFNRKVRRGGAGAAADAVSESAVLALNPPPSTRPIAYRIGAGDQVTLVRFITPRGLPGPLEQTPIVTGSAATTSPAVVGSDGTVQFFDTGSVAVGGKTMTEAREEIANALARNGADPSFQFEVTGYNSQRVGLAIVGGAPAGTSNAVQVSVQDNQKGTGAYPVTERPLSLRELLVGAGVAVSRAGVQVVSIARKGHRYQLPLDRVFAAGSPDYYLAGGDMVQVEEYGYRGEKAYLVGGGSAPVAFDITPADRQTLADILFAEGGPLAVKSARTSEIYVLRGNDPMRAYHLNAQDPSRLRVAAELELRPNDFIFLTTKPISTFNELLTQINPFLVLTN